MSKTTSQAVMFKNRLIKRARRLRSWAALHDIGCYRLYDRDIPEIPLAADLYISAPSTHHTALHSPDPFLKLFFYDRPYSRPEDEERAWLEAMQCAAAEALSLPADHIYLTQRRRQRGNTQYQKGEKSTRIIVREQGALFIVELGAYLDTGLFFDHRPLRLRIKNECSGKRVLNLFAYTASFSVYSALGGAASVDSVDTSNTYLARARDNFLLNGLHEGSYRFIKMDTRRFLAEAAGKKRRWDIIILDPPTFSNSHGTWEDLDLNRDWPQLLTCALSVLDQGGLLYFSTNSRRLSFDSARLNLPFPILAADISSETIPFDFLPRKPHRCWKISL